MQMTRRDAAGANSPQRMAALVAGCLLLAGAMLWTTQRAHAQSYPNKPIKLVVGNVAGGTTDLLGRIIADGLKSRLGQPVVVENRVGAASLVGLEYLMKQPADGSSLICSASSISTLNILNRNATYDAARDFTPIAGITIAPFLVMVRSDFPAQNLAEFVAYAKANPGKINVGATGSGSFDHLAGTACAMKSGTKMTWIAYKGESGALPDLVAGRVDVMFLQWGTTGPHVASGKVRVLASMSAARDPKLNIPTATELGTPVEAAAWFALFGPAGVPKDIVDLLNRETNAVLRGTDAQERIHAVYQQPMLMTPGELGALVRSSAETWGTVIKAANLKVE